MSEIFHVVALCSLVVIILGALSAYVQGTLASLPLLAVATGIVAGPALTGWIDPSNWQSKEIIVREVARFTIAISVVGIAIRTPPETWKRLVRPVTVMLTLGMAGMWAMSTLVSWVTLGSAFSLSFATAVLIAACLTPTDPVAASAIVSGPIAKSMLPANLRGLLSLESGANDGLGYLFVMLPMLAIARGEAGGELVRHWLVDILILDVLLAAGVGIVLGWLVARLQRLSDRHKLAEFHSYHAISIALAFGALGLGRMLGADGILTAFAAGGAFCLTVGRHDAMEEENVHETISKLMDLPAFVIFGLVIPWHGWATLGVWAVLFPLAILLLRRPPLMLALAPLLSSRFSGRDIAFAGWFGPIGIAAIFYAMESVERTGDQFVWYAVSAAVAGSILVHGVTATPGMRLYASRRKAEADDAES